MEFTKNLMRCVQASWFIFFYFIYVFDQKLSTKLKTTCLDWGKKKQQLNLLYFQQL
jgi:hypothetical protein